MSKHRSIAAMLDDNRLHIMSVVEHDGALWIVPAWLPAQTEGYSKPERMLRLDRFQYESFGPGAQWTYGLKDILPKALFHGELSSTLAERYDVQLAPNLQFRVTFPKKH